MSNDAAPLFHPFHTGDVDWPAATARGLFAGATFDNRPPTQLTAAIELIQGFRSDFLRLQQAGYSVSAAPQADIYDFALVLASRHRGMSEARLAQAIDRVKPGGLIAMAGSKSDGAASLRKRLAQSFTLGGHLAKNHGEVFWFENDANAQNWAQSTMAEQDALPLADGKYYARPGMFSHDRIDAGSRLLTEVLPDNLAGAAADVCAGWGYLSVSIAERNPGISSVDLYEADHASLQAAQHNMAGLVPHIRSGAHWLDLTSEPVEALYDVVVMNPPFHHGRAADPGIGLAMIRAASRVLKPGGQMFMVANRGLPYDELLRKAFRHSKVLAEDKTFIVTRAIR